MYQLQRQYKHKERPSSNSNQFLMIKRRQLDKIVKGKNHRKGNYRKRSQNRKKRKPATSLGGRFSDLTQIKSQTSNLEDKRKPRKL